MTLLFDQNLAPRLVRDLADLFPASAHVVDFGLESVPDQEIWNRARDSGFVIVSKDNDFQQLPIRGASKGDLDPPRKL